ncbi:hypothetical protein BJV82DRAFT_593174 [Fennellomyces sp. T-0311]|nr:hypothetical protein BJV82DRAFT_593174 [Fennellomyces sp. T-0311]
MQHCKCNKGLMIDAQNHAQNLFRRNGTINTYKTTNMNGKRLPPHAATVSSLPPRGAYAAASSSSEVITIEDKRKRKVVDSMKRNQYGRQFEDARATRNRQDSPSKRRKDFSVIKSDSDEEIMMPKTFKRLQKGKSRSNSSDTDLDQYHDAKDVFDIDSIEPAGPPRKRRQESRLFQQNKRRQEEQEARVFRKPVESVDNKDTTDDEWEQLVAAANDDHTEKPEPKIEIPPLNLRKRREGIVFHSHMDDIPVRGEKAQKTKSTTYRTSSLTQRVTRSVSLGIRRILGQPQYITIDDDDEEAMERHDISPPRADQNEQRVLFHYPTSTPGGVTVIREDANRLMDGEMLNDSIIDFYVKWLLETMGRDNTENVHIFNTFFYARLKQVTKGDPYESVKKWTTKINLFEKDTIFVPINECSHWYLIVICNAKRCIPSEGNYIDLSDDDNDDSKAVIYSLDSMGISRRAAANRIIKYLQSAAKDRLGIEESRFKKPKYQKATVPLQPNAYDCGIYVLHFIETFLINPVKVIPALTQKELDDNIWQQKVIDEKRSYITELIAGLCQDQVPGDTEAETTTDAPSTPTAEWPDTPVYTSAA